MRNELPKLISPEAKRFYKRAIENHKYQVKQLPNLTPARKPRFDYQNLPDTERLNYELLTWKNFTQILDLFQNETSPFISDEFKSLKGVELYSVSQLEYNRYSFKRGACDWFLRLKTTNELVGILHIYALNWELYDGKHPACVVGYAIAEQHRRKHYATEALTHLLEQIPIVFKRYEVMANPKVKNIASRRLLENLGFKENFEVGEDDTWWERKLVDDIPLKTFEQVWEEEMKYR